MTEQDNAFLKFLIHEEIYLIDHESEEIASNEVQSGHQEVINAADVKGEGTKNSTVQADEENPQAVLSQRKDVNDLKKPVLVIYGHSDRGAMPPEQKAYLGKILSAVKVNIDEIDLLSAKQEAEWESYERIICFTRKYANCPISSAYDIQKVGSVQWLLADELNTIEASRDLRQSLWTCLQKLFF